jgi:hypothetical protein
MLKRIAINDMQVIFLNGKDNINKFNLRGVVNTPGFNRVTSLGIVKDADGHAKNTFMSICGILKKVNLPSPKRPAEIVKINNFNIGILIIPPEELSGTLEDICLFAIGQYKEMECVEEYFKCLSRKVAVDKLPKNLSKAKIQAFLASREHSVPHLGIAIEKGYFPLDHKIFDNIKNFLKLL